jgi:prepilin-type N-terminal cleavage/methylation domain-containing protein
VKQPTPTVTPRGRASGGRRRRGGCARGPGGFTLLEVLIAITLTVALAAVVLPVSVSWLGAAGLDEAAPRLESALSLARADAQRRGVVLEIYAAAAADGTIELRSRELGVERTDADDVGVPAVQEGEAEDSGEETVLAELPLGVLLRRVNPGDLQEAGLDDVGVPGGTKGSAGNRDESDEARLVIALALPDGRIVAEEQAAELRAVGDDGRWSVLMINGWTGAVVSRAGVAAREDEASEPPEDPAERRREEAWPE